jgi:hypothetical protein
VAEFTQSSEQKKSFITLPTGLPHRLALAAEEQGRVLRQEGEDGAAQGGLPLHPGPNAIKPFLSVNYGFS